MSATVTNGVSLDAIKRNPIQPSIKGLITPGNINLQNRPQVPNPKGGTSTVYSTSVNVDGKEILLPLVTDDGRIVSPQEAVQIYKTTGKHLGVFDSSDNATSYAKQLHEDQAKEYGLQ